MWRGPESSLLSAVDVATDISTARIIAATDPWTVRQLRTSHVTCNSSFLLETYIRGVDICQNDCFHGDIFCSNMLLYCNFTDFPILVHLRDVDGRVLAVLPFTETLRHARRQTPVVNAAQRALVIFTCGRTGRRRLPSDQY